MKKILIVDDSALMRRILSDIINSDAEMRVTNTAANGLEALQMLKAGFSFDVIILDLIMPKMTGLEFLEALEQMKSKENVLIVSTIAQEGAAETIRALELGAFDFIPKPENLSEIRSLEFSKNLLSLIKVCAESGIHKKHNTSGGSVQAVHTPMKNVDYSQPLPTRKREVKEAVAKKESLSHKVTTGVNKLVALACSTGGPKALQSVIPKLPANLDAAVLIVQHMPKGFTASLSSRLNELSSIHVKEAEEGDLLQKGTVYIARGGMHMKILEHSAHSHSIHLDDAPARNALKPCADIMYESLKKSSFDEITCVVMTGMGADGTKGIQQLNQTNKIYVIAQDEESSIVYGMPKNIAEAGLTNEIEALDQIAATVTRHVGVQ